MTQKSVIIWAIDPFSGDWKAQKNAAQAIAALTAGLPSLVQPVYIAANPLPNLPKGFSIEVFEGVREKAQDRFEQMIKGVQLESIAPVKIIQVKNLSTTEQITELLAYARDLGAGLIVAGTRARRGVPRWFFGSFVESLTLQSDIPLLTVNPKWNAARKMPRNLFKKILFPTDFSEPSHQAFQEVVHFAKANGAEIQVFHKYYHLVEPVWNSPLEAKLSYREIIEDGLRAIKSQAEEWAEEARKQGVRSKVKIDSGPGDSTAEAILNQAKAGNWLIAMASQSGRVEVNLMGSVTRRVIRQAENPVWVLHPDRRRINVRKGRNESGESRLREYEDKKGFEFPKVG